MIKLQLVGSKTIKPVKYRSMTLLLYPLSVCWSTKKDILSQNDIMTCVTFIIVYTFFISVNQLPVCKIYFYAKSTLKVSRNKKHLITCAKTYSKVLF